MKLVIAVVLFGVAQVSSASMPRPITSQEDLVMIGAKITFRPDLETSGDQSVSKTFTVTWETGDHDPLLPEPRLDLVVSTTSIPFGTLNDGVRVQFQKTNGSKIVAKFSVADHDLESGTLWFWMGERLGVLDLELLVRDFKVRSPFEDGGFSFPESLKDKKD